MKRRPLISAFGGPGEITLTKDSTHYMISSALTEALTEQDRYWNEA